MDFLSDIFGTTFMPHGHCYAWRPGLVWLHSLSDGAISAAYFSIPVSLAIIVRRRQDLVYPWLFLMFSMFIFLCGTTHVMNIWSIWNGTYYMTGAVKAVTGLVSLLTAVVLVPVVPKVLQIPSPEELRRTNELLRQEIDAREAAELRLRTMNEELERRVGERTAELERINGALRVREGELEELNRTLEERVRVRTGELAQANETLERRNKELQDFAHVASHDLKEPLRKIQTFTDIVVAEQGEKLDEEGRSYLARVQSAAGRMSTLMDGLLSYSRISTRGEAFQPVDLQEEVEQVLQDLEVRVRETGGAVEVGELPVIEADALQMRQLFQNLIANGLKFHREGVPPRVQVRGRVEGRTDLSGRPAEVLRLEVEDNGIGFDPKYVEKIFAPFQRLHGRSEFEGTGMGLAICRRIVERHHGTITAESVPEQGTVFIVEVPVRQGASGTREATA